MDEERKSRVQDAAVPMCEEFFQGAFASLDAMDPQWNELGVDLDASQLMFAKTLFHFACFPLVLMIQVVYKRLPEDDADELLDIVLAMFLPVLVKHFLDLAKVTETEVKTAFRDEFVSILQLQIHTYLKHDHATGCQRLAWLLSEDLKGVVVDHAPDLANVIETSFPPMIEAQAQKMLPGYVQTAITFADAVTAA